MIDFENDWFWKLIIITFLMEWSLSPHWKWNWSYMYKGKMYIDHEKTWDLISKWIVFFCIIYPKTNTLPGNRWCHSSRAQRRRGRGLKWLNIQPRIRPPTPARSFCICAGTDHTWGRGKWRSNKICLCSPMATRLYSGAHNKSSHRQVVQLRHNGNCPAQPWWQKCTFGDFACQEPVKGVRELSHGDERLAANCSTVWINLQDVDQVDLKAR